MWSKIWIASRKTKKGVNYDVRWYDQYGYQHSESAGTNRRTAESLRKKEEWELNHGLLTSVERIVYDRFVAEHLALREGTVAPSTIRVEERVLKLVKQICRPRLVSDLTPLAVEKFKVTRLKGRSANYVNIHLRTLRSILEKAIKRGYLKSNPAKGVDMARSPQKSIRALSVQEIETLLRACSNLKWQVFCYLGAACGLRVGEITNLRWDDVDLSAGAVYVRNQQEWSTKSGQTRAVGLSKRAVEMLERLRLQTGFQKYVLTTKKGRRWTNNINRDFDVIRRRAGIGYCTPHDLRKTFCSHLAMAGLNEAIVQRLAGHANISTTLKYYTEIFDGKLKDATRKLAY